ncbi:MAG: four helix bundle protein [Verrucomicrobia bacterium]|nr:four helix bundle protein [Verrucomicrobiota bacterium]
MDEGRTNRGDNESWEEDSRYPEVSAEAFELREGPDGRPQFPFDLEERTSKFGEAIIRFTQKIPRSPGNDRLIGQLVGCGTSVGANYCEADEAVSKKEFAVKIGTCKKEARETKFFLRMTATAVPDLKVEARQLWREARELHLIFARIYRTCKEGGGSGQ